MQSMAYSRWRNSAICSSSCQPCPKEGTLPCNFCFHAGRQLVRRFCRPLHLYIAILQGTFVLVRDLCGFRRHLIWHALPVKFEVSLSPVCISPGSILRKLGLQSFVNTSFHFGLIRQAPSNLRYAAHWCARIHNYSTVNVYNYSKTSSSSEQASPSQFKWLMRSKHKHTVL